MAAGWSAAVGAGINAVMNLMGSDSSNATSVLQNKELMKYQTKLNQKGAKWQALNIPSLNRQGIENAGYNPMLALNGLTNANSNWAGLGTPTTSNKGLIGTQRVEMQNALEQQENNNILAQSQADNYNADSQLKQVQAQTEFFKQAEADANASLINSEKILNDQRSSNFEREQARLDKEVAIMEKDSIRRYKVGMVQGQASTMQAQASMSSAKTQANALEVQKPYLQAQAQAAQWNADHPYQSRLLPAIPGAAAGIGGALLLRSPVGKAAGAIESIGSGHRDYHNYNHQSEYGNKIYRHFN